MTADSEATRIWRVRVESHRTRGEWFFVAFDTAQLFVERRLGREDTRWRRDRCDKWVVEHEEQTWTVAAEELQDAAAIVVDEAATHPL